MIPESIVKQSSTTDLSSASESGDVRSGSPLPYGAHQRGDGVNFALFSRHAARVRLELYKSPEDSSAYKVFDLDPVRNRTGDVWHIWVHGLPPGQLYAYRIDGPYQPAQGHRFNAHKLLLDPYATAVTRGAEWSFPNARGYDPRSKLADLSFSTLDNASTTPKCMLYYNDFDWEGDLPPRHPSSETVVYETHVRGCTFHPGSEVAHPGTFRGLAEKIPYFQDLGVTAIELMPVQEFNENELVRLNPLSGERLRNYWGYSPAALFAPKESYGLRGSHGDQVFEFRNMVKAFHRAGIELILDIVLNHTAEANELGPTICLRGIDNSIFYMLQENDRRYYKNYSGVGNTVNANHPVVSNFVMEVLRYWVMHMHVDGFRFDLASVLGRNEHGDVLRNAPLLERIAEDPILRDVKIIAEAWDAGGAYQVGSFSERRWIEWNGRFRDDVRRFWLGEPAMTPVFASRICGSADLYGASGKGPGSSLNFITAHDGFTLNDLVSYRQKHNEENGEFDRDGSDANYSENCGVEGPSDAPEIEALRKRLIKNFLLTLFISRGIPMLLGGDEFRRTQKGNNNAYCQDNSVSWFDWSFVESHREIYRFTREMIAFRRAHSVLRKEAFYSNADVTWVGPQGGVPEWSNPAHSAFACLIFGYTEADLFLMFNAGEESVIFPIPAATGTAVWQLAADTSRSAPEDFSEVGQEPALQDQSRFRLGPRSSAILLRHVQR
jgi:isoamylase